MQEEEIKRLENLKDKVKLLSCNMSNIELLDRLINSELLKEEELDLPNKVYVFHLKQTITKELNTLKTSRKKPENRVKEFNEASKNFLIDINRKIGDLRQK